MDMYGSTKLRELITSRITERNQKSEKLANIQKRNEKDNKTGPVIFKDAPPVELSMFPTKL
jgi:hypothetical protein